MNMKVSPEAVGMIIVAVIWFALHTLLLILAI
jgi:hypothetical protein